MRPGGDTVRGQSIPCRDGDHDRCWRRTAFGGLWLVCTCDCHQRPAETLSGRVMFP